MSTITKKLFVMLSIGLFVTQAHAADIYVSSSGANANDGTTLSTAFATINKAYDDAKNKPGDDVIIISGLISLTGQITLIDSSGSVSFVSADDGYEGTQAVINNGGNNNRLFFTNASSVTAISVFTGLEFENISNSVGSGSFFGSNNSSSITFNDCKFTNLSSSVIVPPVTDPVTAPNVDDNTNGIIQLSNTSMTFNTCVFDSNSTLNGNGGVFSVLSGGTLILNDCLFTGNSASQANKGKANGGAISVVGTGGVTISNTTFYNNSSELQGGALFIAKTASTCTLTNVTMFGNGCSTVSGAARGGALRSESWTRLLVENSLFYGNNVSTSGTPNSSDVGFGDVEDATGAAASSATFTNTLIGKTVLGEDSANFIETNSVLNADLASSALSYDSLDGKVKYVAATSGDSPIDFGSDANDVGAWDSELSLPPLSTQSLNRLKNISIYNLSNGNVQFTLEGSSNAKVFDLLGNCISSFSINNSYELEANSFLPGVYILNITIDGKKYVQKFIVQ